MQKFLQASILVVLLGLVGCGPSISTRPDTVEVAGTVVFSDGKPVGNVTMLILPTAQAQNQGSAILKADGKFELKLVPGTYTFAFEGANLNAIPKSYQSADAEHKFEVPSAGNKSMTITVNK